MKRFFVTWLLATVSFCSAEFAIRPENLHNGKLVQNSKSTKHVGLYCIHRGLTTVTQTVLMDRKKAKILTEVPILTTYASPKLESESLKVCWNSEGTAVTIHDTSNLKKSGFSLSTS